MDIKQVNSAIMFGTFTDTELASIIDAVRFARAGIQRQNMRALRLGSTVKWTSGKNPQGASGEVTKLGRKFVTVKTASGQLWRVPANMLEVVKVNFK